jgi:type III pantothenate kinase
MNLVIDCGNSAAKVGIFEGYELKKRLVLPTDSELQMFLKNADYENVMISSVKGNSDLLSAWAMHAKKKFILKHSLPLPVNNLYATPATLGVDRLAGVCGAQQIFPMKHCLVIDAGTCITYDFIDKEKNYLGGGISPCVLRLCIRLPQNCR